MNKYIFKEVQKVNWLSDNFFYLDKIEISDDRGLESVKNILNLIMGKKKEPTKYHFEANDYFP